MAPPLYNSEILQFVIGQSHRLRAQVAQAWRWTQVATVWGIQVVVATAYGGWYGVRTGWRLGHQLVQTVKGAWLKLGESRQSDKSFPQLSSDTPIRHILALTLETGVATTPPPISTQSQPFPALVRSQGQRLWAGFVQGLTSLSRRIQIAPARPPATTANLLPPLEVRGIASDLATGRLAWVTATTVVVLDAPAHRALQQRIIWELADYGYRWRQWQRRQRRIQGHHHGLAQVLNRMGLPWPDGWGNNASQKRALPGAVTTDLAVQGWAGALVRRGRLLWRRWPSLEHLPVPAWLWQAIGHFLSIRSDRALASNWDRLGRVGTPTFSLTVVPGLITLGQSLSTWFQRCFRPWCTGLSLGFWPQTPVAQPPLPEPAAPSLAPLPVPSSGLSVACFDDSIWMGTAGATPITMGMAPDLAGTWLDVPATLVGYGQSPLVWLLTRLDWALVQLERLAAWLWRYLRILGWVMRWVLLSQRFPTIHLMTSIPTPCRKHCPIDRTGEL